MLTQAKKWVSGWQSAGWVKKIVVILAALLAMMLVFRIATIVFWTIAGVILLGLAWICRTLWRAFKHTGLNI